jgi:light-regulated signal transduction histidine kinase (bacteriophytochrome)
MGLAICRRIVERHAGEITVRSQPGVGTTFMVTLPVNHSRNSGAEQERRQASDENPGVTSGR